jgi:acetyl esterase/lipase
VDGPRVSASTSRRRRSIAEITVFPVGPTGSVRIRIVRPEGFAAQLPVVMHFHGGGWILGDKDTHDRFTREIALGTNAAVVFVDYDRSPEVHYPVAIEQVYAATKYVAEHANDLGLDSSRLALIGDSVGGNMVAAVTLLAKQRGGPRINLQVLCYPGAVIVGTGKYTYEALATWQQLPAGMRLIETPGVAVDARDRVHAQPGPPGDRVRTRRCPCLLVRSGGFSDRTHGIQAGPDGSIYCADDGTHTITKFTSDGQLLMTLGERDQPAPRWGGQPFNRLTHVAVSPTTGHLYVSDGCGNSRVHRYTADGQ